LTLAKNVLLSAISCISSLGSNDDFFPSFGLIFSPSTLSLAFDSAADTSSVPSPGIEAALVSTSTSLGSSFSVSVFDSCFTGLLGSATTVAGSAVSNALNKTYTVHQGSCRCLCRSLQKDRVRLVFLQAEQTGVFGSNGVFT